MQLIVAEFAAVNQDGTFTVVRGGVDSWKSKTIPFDLGAWLLLDVDSGKLETGLVPIRVSVRDAADNAVFDLMGHAMIAHPEGRVRAAVNFGGKIVAAGPLTIEAHLGLETGRHIVNVILDSES